jgi:signal transduction histidine kinase
MFSVQESERRVLARELHDELGQWLTAIQAEAEAIRSNAGVNRDNRMLLSAKAIGNSAGEIHRLIRQMLGRLRPSLLDSLGLSESLQALTAQWKQHHPQITCDLDIQGDLHGIPESFGITAYRLVQEALTNVAKHSQAKRVTVSLHCDNSDAGKPGCLRLTIVDDGKGMNVNQVQSGLGLMGMRERVIAAGGEFSLSSEPRQGVQINVLLPIPGLPNGD